eukprot:scaffold8060_cov444-Prasinococcus_capsulatus_cf.AAC.2
MNVRSLSPCATGAPHMLELLRRAETLDHRLSLTTQVRARTKISTQCYIDIELPHHLRSLPAYNACKQRIRKSILHVSQIRQRIDEKILSLGERQQTYTAKALTGPGQTPRTQGQASRPAVGVPRRVGQFAPQRRPHTEQRQGRQVYQGAPKDLPQRGPSRASGH